MNCTPPDAPPSRFVKRGMFWVCLECDLTAQYCMCAVAQASTARPRGDCGYCGRALAECRCGTTPARDAPP